MIETSQNLAERRDQVVSETYEQIAQLTELINGTMLTNFPAAKMMRQNAMQGKKSDSIRQRLYITPFFVLPAREVSSGNEKNAPMVRRIAAYMMLGYDYPASESKKIWDGIRTASIPVPDSICIPAPHPVAIQADIDANKDLFEYDSRSISGTHLKLLPWVLADSHDFGNFPREGWSYDKDETFDFGVFRDYPPEAMVHKAHAIDIHQERLERFKKFATLFALSLDNPDLNPRSA